MSQSKKKNSISISRSKKKTEKVIENVEEDTEIDHEDDKDDKEDFGINYYLYESLKETFENELFKIFKAIERKHGENYMFKKEDLIDFYKSHDLQFFYKKTPKHQPRIVEYPDDEKRCCGRIWAGGYMDENQFGDRCQRKRIDGSDYCKQHTENLPHGRFDNEPPAVVKGFYVKENDKSRTCEDIEQ